MSANTTSYDTFCMTRYLAPILPWAMASGGVSLSLLWMGSALRGMPNLAWLALLQVGGGALLVILAWACRRMAKLGLVRPTVATIIVYGLLFSSIACLVADNNGEGLTVVFPFCMILLVIGSFFAMSVWHLLAGYLATMIPPVLLAAHIERDLLSEVIPRLLMLTLATGLTFCFLVGRFRRSYFDLLQREQERSRRDPLTGLFNRTAWHERVEQMEDPRRAAILYIDIDYFKQVNDTRGHTEGDRVLQRVAESITASLDAGDIVARFGGEEFVAFLPGVDTRTAKERVVRIRQTIDSRSDGETRITISAGIARQRANEALETTVYRADQALMQAKADGRNRTVIADDPAEPMPVPEECSPEIGQPLPAQGALA